MNRMEALIWILLPGFTAVASGLLAWFIMQSRLEVALALQRERLAETKGALDAEKSALGASLDTALRAAEAVAKQEALEHFMDELRVEQRHYTRENRTLTKNRKTLVLQERMYFRTIPLSDWVEHEVTVDDIVGEEDLATPQPVRILVFKNAQGWTSPAPLTECRDRYAIVLSEKNPVPPAVYGELTRLLLDANTNRMPAAFEHGLIEFFSTFQIGGIHITVGAPPPQPDLDFARIHLLVAAPEYFGKLRVLLYNLRKGVDDDPAYHNAFGKSAAEVEAQARQHFAARQFPTTTISSRPVAPDDFHEKPISDADVRLARADLLAGPQSAAEYRSLLNEHLKIPESEEGLWVLELRDHQDR